MHLTKEEQAIIDGHQGEGASIAMKVLVGIGQVFDASRLVPIRRAHVSLSNQEGDTWFAEKLQKAGAKCLVPPTVNPGYCMDFFLSKGLLSNEDIDSMRRCHEAYKNLGAQMNYSCTPHLLENVPLLGEVVAYSESSATVFINSVCGARSNRESSQSALCAAIVGRVPEYGLLLDENRRAQALIKVEADLSDDFFYSILGWLTPKKIDNLIPVYSGIRERPTPEALINLGTELNVTGAIPMFHIAGFTPVDGLFTFLGPGDTPTPTATPSPTPAPCPDDISLNGGFESWNDNGPGGPPDDWTLATDFFTAGSFFRRLKHEFYPPS